MQGKGIIIDVANNMKKTKLKDDQKYILQKFIDTSAGIEGIVDGLHDLRVVIVEGEIVWCHVRRPKAGTYLANVALGGSIEEVEINRIPSYIIDAVHKIQSMIDNKYNMPLYSIDFGISSKTPYVFELNDQIGFPKVSMKNKDLFISNIIKSLERLSR
jgi:glutathione synthase/RimK-type ligase-like ATP-grasp enzyme